MRTKAMALTDRAIGVRMRALRLQRGLSQMQVGEKLGVTFQQIQKYESGRNRLAGSRLVMMCELLKCRATDLLGNGDGVFADEPDTLMALQDKDITRMLLAVNQLPRSKRRAVAQCLLLLVRAFQQKI
jgi:transcriptional regulator with XRE-family HTH domain